MRAWIKYACAIGIALGTVHGVAAESTPRAYALEASKGELTKRGCGDANAAAFIDGFVDRETWISVDVATDLVTMHRRDNTWATVETMVRGRPPYFGVWRSGTGAGRWTLIMRIEPPSAHGEIAKVTFSAIQYSGERPCVSQWRGPAKLGDQ